MYLVSAIMPSLASLDRHAMSFLFCFPSLRHSMSNRAEVITAAHSFLPSNANGAGTPPLAAPAAHDHEKSCCRATTAPAPGSSRLCVRGVQAEENQM